MHTELETDTERERERERERETRKDRGSSTILPAALQQKSTQRTTVATTQPPALHRTDPCTEGGVMEADGGRQWDKLGDRRDIFFFCSFSEIFNKWHECFWELDSNKSNRNLWTPVTPVRHRSSWLCQRERWRENNTRISYCGEENVKGQRLGCVESNLLF